MMLPGLSLACLTPGTCLSPLPGLGSGVVSHVAGSMSNAAASAVLGVVGASMTSAADWLVGHVMGLIHQTHRHRFLLGWFQAERGAMEVVVTMVLLPVLMVASIGPVLRQDLRRLLRVWGVGLPVAVLAGVAASQLAGLALAATDEMCSGFLGSGGRHLASQFSQAMANGAVSGAPVFVQMLLASVMVVGAVLVWLEMMVRSAAVYVAVFFTPLALVGYIWPSTAGMARRGVEILVSLILSKFVIVATLSLGLSALGAHGVDSAIAGGGLMLLAGFAPFTVMRLAPVVEAAAIGHLEGVSRRPVRAATRVVGSATAAPSHPVSQLLLSGLSGRSGHGGAAAQPSQVAAQALVPRAADYPLPGGGADGSPRRGKGRAGA